MMTKRERALAALDGRPTERPPVSLWFHFGEDAQLGRACIQAHLDYYEAWNVDIAKGMCDGYFDYPNPVAKNARDAKDWRSLRPLGTDHPFFRDQIERARTIREELPDDRLFYYTTFAPFSTIRYGAGDETVMRHLREDPESVLVALDAIAEDNAAFNEALIREAGCDGIYYCLQGGERGRMSGEEYRRWITPSDRAVLDRINAASDLTILHCCGWAGIRNRMENWQDYPARAYNWAVHVEGLSLSDGKRFFGGACVLGGLDNRRSGPVFSGTRDEVDRAVASLAEERVGPGFVVGFDCALASDLPRERVGWVLDAVRERFGG